MPLAAHIDAARRPSVVPPPGRVRPLKGLDGAPGALLLQADTEAATACGAAAPRREGAMAAGGSQQLRLLRPPLSLSPLLPPS